MTYTIYTKRNERIKAFFSKCREVKESLTHIRENWHPVLNGHKFITDKELAQRLRVSRRTLHEYRAHGIIPYYILGGKIIYSEKDIAQVLDRNYFTDH